jgi:WD40 repeat protein
MKFLFCLLFLTSASYSFSQEKVEVVIASGLDWAVFSAISSDKRLVAKGVLTSCSVWDAKTGRLIRNIQYSSDLTKQGDTMWFSPDNLTLNIKMPMSNDKFQVDVRTGKSEFVKGAAMDYTNFVYKFSNRQKSTSHLYSNNMKDLTFKSPDNKTTIIYKKIKNPVGSSTTMPHAFEMYLKSDGAKVGPLDTVYSASFVFSEDCKYLFAEQSIYNLDLNKKMAELKTVPFSGRSVSFLPGTRIPVTSGIDGITIWDFPKVRNISLPNLINFKSSNDGNLLICEFLNRKTDQRNYKTYDLEKDKWVGKVLKVQESSYVLDQSPNGDNFAYIEMKKVPGTEFQTNYKVKVVDHKSAKVLKTFDYANKAFFLDEPNKIIVDSLSVTWFKKDLITGESSRFPTEGVELATYLFGVSQEHNYLFGSSNHEIKPGVYGTKFMVWDATSGKLVFENVDESHTLGAGQVSKDKKYVCYSSATNNNVFIFDFKTGTKLFELEGHGSLVEEARFSDDAKRLITSSLDGTRRIWNLESGTPMVSLISTGPKDFAIVTPDQYYYATKGAKKMIHFVKGIDIFPFGQFDLKYNRPDLIIQSLEASNFEMIEPFRKAYEKRLKKMGFTEDMLDGQFNLPMATITNENDIPFVTDLNTLKIDVSASDEKFNLDRLIIRVNEVPVNGREGITVAEKSSKEISQSLELELSQGRNVIEVSALNSKGVESLTHSVTVNYESENVNKPTLHVYAIGVSKYQQDNFNLEYAAKDAQDLVNLFDSKNLGFMDVKTHLITNEEVNVKTIEALKADLEKTKVDDIVCMFYAGHGVLDADLNYFIASNDMDFTNPAEKGIPYDSFEDLMDGIPARRKLMMLDACHSGEIDKDELVAVEEDLGSDGSDGDLTFRAVNSTTTKNLGLSNSFELMKELFTDLRKSSGTVIISSAGGLEFAIEGGEWNNGVFTYSFISGLTEMKADENKDGRIMLGEMNEYIREAVFELTKGRQQPTNRAEVLESDWRLW